jgi:predicted O-methyltransferase YrrM
MFRPNHKEISAWQGHLPFASWIIDALNPKVFVELGTHGGTSYFTFCQAVAGCESGTKTYAVDTWRGDNHAGFYNEDVYNSVVEVNRQYESFSQLLRMTFDEARDKFDDESIDLLHIDGFHTYDAVKHDFETWLPKMSKDGVVLFHDIAVRRDDFGVYRFWDEVRKNRRSLSFPHSFGLGVLQLGDAESKVIPVSDTEKANMVEFFKNLGLRTTELEWAQFELDAIKRSYSWRVTAPLRALLSFIKNL